MKANQVAMLVLKLMGVYFIIEGVSAVGEFSITMTPVLKDDAISFATVAVLTLVAPIVCGILLMACSASWGKQLVPQNMGEEKISAVSFDLVQALAFAVVGGMADRICGFRSSILWMFTS